MGIWKLANSKNIPDLLDKTDKFLGMDTELSGFYNMYPNIDFEDIDDLEPEWFEKSKDYQIFDVGYKHGHFSTSSFD